MWAAAAARRQRSDADELGALEALAAAESRSKQTDKGPRCAWESCFGSTSTWAYLLKEPGKTPHQHALCRIHNTNVQPRPSLSLLRSTPGTEEEAAPGAVEIEEEDEDLGEDDDDYYMVRRAGMWTEIKNGKT